MMKAAPEIAGISGAVIIPHVQLKVKENSLSRLRRQLPQRGSPGAAKQVAESTVFAGHSGHRSQSAFFPASSGAG